MKIFKYFTGAKISSYKLKYALHYTFRNTEPTNEGIGIYLKKVLDHYWIRGNFESVSDELQELGIEKIVLGTVSVDFVGKF